LGEISEERWLGSSGSGALLVVGKAKEPFRRVEVVFWLEAREFLPMWLLNRFRNKHDLIILKAGLRNIPSHELRLASSKDSEFQQEMAERKMSFKELTIKGNYLLAYRGKQNSTLNQRVEGFLSIYGGAIQSLAFQQKAPHFLLSMYLHPLLKMTEEDFSKDLSRLTNHGG
jgi:hypothetical protein